MMVTCLLYSLSIMLIGSITQRFTGPAVDDILRFFDDWTGPLSFGVDKIRSMYLKDAIQPHACYRLQWAVGESYWSASAEVQHSD